MECIRSSLINDRDQFTGIFPSESIKETSLEKAKISYEPLKIALSESLRNHLTSFQLEDLEKACIEDYSKSLDLLEESIADVILESAEVERFITFCSLRLLQLLEVYAEVLGEAANSEAWVSLDPDFRLYALLSQLSLSKLSSLSLDAGQTGINPIALKKVLLEGNFRERMFLIQLVRSPIMEELAKNPDQVAQINRKLSENRADWRLDEELSCFKDSAAHVKLSRKGRVDILRDKRSPEERERLRSYLVPTLQEACDLEGHFLRIPLSEREARYAVKEPLLSCVSEKRWRERLFWLPGEVYWRSKSPNVVKDSVSSQDWKIVSPYLEASMQTKMAQISGISGSTDFILSTLSSMGMTSSYELYMGRLLCLGWLLDLRAHSVCEVLVAAQSFGMPFTFKSTYYQELVPEEFIPFHSEFMDKLKFSQNLRGYELPDFYLSETHVLKKAEELGIDFTKF